MEATYGFTSQIIGILPERCRPQREIRCLAPLLRRSKDEASIGIPLMSVESEYHVNDVSMCKYCVSIKSLGL